MADMYGAIKSNEFKVKDADYFEQWFLANVSFGNDITIYREVDKEGITSFMFGNPDAYYPNAYPKKAYDEEAEDDEEWELEAFAIEIRKHLLPGEEFRVFACGNEKLRYASAPHLILTHTTVEFNEFGE